MWGIKAISGGSGISWSRTSLAGCLTKIIPPQVGLHLSLKNSLMIDCFNPITSLKTRNYCSQTKYILTLKREIFDVILGFYYMTSKGYRSIFLTLENAISDGFVRENKYYILIHLVSVCSLVVKMTLRGLKNIILSSW